MSQHDATRLPPSRSAEQIVIAICLIVVGTVLSFARSGYYFGRSDDALQSALLERYADSQAYSGDMLVDAAFRAYRSIVFPALAPFTAVSSIESIYWWSFVVNRVCLIASFFLLARQVSRDWLLTCVLLLSLGFLGNSLGGVPILESQFAPRTASLPIAILAIVNLLAGRWIYASLLINLTALVHPVTCFSLYLLMASMWIIDRWLNFFPSYLLPRKQTSVGWILSSGIGLLGMFCWSRLTQTEPSQLVIDSAWRAIITETVGGFVYVMHAPEWNLHDLGGTLALGLVLLLFPLPEPARRFRLYAWLVSGAAVVLHLVSVDLLNLHPALQACPMRATFLLTLATYLNLAFVVTERLRSPSIGLQLTGAAILAVNMLDIDRIRFWGPMVLLLLPALGSFLPTTFRDCCRLKRGTLVTLWCGLMGVVIIGLAGGMLFAPKPMVQLLTLLSDKTGLATRVDSIDAVASGRENLLLKDAMLWIDQHAGADDRVMPPWYGGVRSYARRPFTMSEQFATYTHLSRNAALRYQNWCETIQSRGKGKGVSTLLELAALQQANWLIVDRDEEAANLDDPQPAFANKRYCIYRVTQRR